MTIDFAARAGALVGTPFRLQGRGEGGLDCVGVILTSFRIDAGSVRRNYRMRGEPFGDVESTIDRYFRRIPATRVRAGDLLLLAPAADQPHLAVKTEVGFVHADAGLRRVVETPGEPRWPLLSAYRRRSRRKGR